MAWGYSWCHYCVPLNCVLFLWLEHEGLIVLGDDYSRVLFLWLETQIVPLLRASLLCVIPITRTLVSHMSATPISLSNQKNIFELPFPFSSPNFRCSGVVEGTQYGWSFIARASSCLLNLVRLYETADIPVELSVTNLWNWVLAVTSFFFIRLY